MHLNQCTIIGQLADDPETRFLDSGHQLTTVSLRIEEEGRDGKTYKTFIPVEAYGRAGEALAECSKGDTTVITGKLAYRSWTDKEGTKRGTIKVSAWQVKPLHAPVTAGSEANGEDDVPF